MKTHGPLSYNNNQVTCKQTRLHPHTEAELSASLILWYFSFLVTMKSQIRVSWIIEWSWLLWTYMKPKVVIAIVAAGTHYDNSKTWSELIQLLHVCEIPTQSPSAEVFLRFPSEPFNIYDSDCEKNPKF